jgi:hypothetical protein
MDQDNLIPLDHIPIAKPRSGTPGESIYLRLWQEYLAAHPGKLERILNATLRPTTQRDASICASFMVFMGCNGGRSIHLKAEQLMQHGMREHDAFMAAWALDNQRTVGINHGLRTIEYMLAAEHPIQEGNLGSRGIDWTKVPTISMDDIDTVECMAAWWASFDGAQMRAIAEPMIAAESRRLLSILFKPATTQEPSHDQS